MAVITCTHCGASGNAPDQILGQQVRCSKCKKSFLAEAESPRAPESPFAVDDEPPPEQEEEEGFPTNEDIGRPTRRSARRNEDDDDPPPRSIRKPASGGGLGDLLMFRRMIAPHLIIILFWMMVVAVVAGSLGMIGMGFTLGSGGIPLALGGILNLVIGPIVVRLWCEVLIVIFRINETLTDIRTKILKDE